MAQCGTKQAGGDGEHSGVVTCGPTDPPTKKREGENEMAIHASSIYPSFLPPSPAAHLSERPCPPASIYLRPGCLAGKERARNFHLSLAVLDWTVPASQRGRRANPYGFYMRLRHLSVSFCAILRYSISPCCKRFLN